MHAPHNSYSRPYMLCIFIFTVSVDLKKKKVKKANAAYYIAMHCVLLLIIFSDCIYDKDLGVGSSIAGDIL